MKVLVTGGSGFIGSHIVDRLLKEEHQVSVLDLWNSENTQIHSHNPNFSFSRGTVLEGGLLSNLIKGKDRVVHLAAVLGTSETITTYDVEQVAETNVVGTVKLLKYCKD